MNLAISFRRQEWGLQYTNQNKTNPPQLAQLQLGHKNNGVVGSEILEIGSEMAKLRKWVYGKGISRWAAQWHVQWKVAKARAGLWL